MLYLCFLFMFAIQTEGESKYEAVLVLLSKTSIFSKNTIKIHNLVIDNYIYE